MNRKVMATYLLARLGEPSSWRGLTFLVTSFGVSLSPEQATTIVSVGVAVAGAIGAFVPDKT